MRFKGTLWLSLAFAGIVLYYFYLEIPAEKKQKEQKELSEKVVVFSTLDVDEVSIARKNQTIVIQRKDAGPWEIVQPLNARADQSAIETLLDKLRDIKYSRVVDENPADLSLFGLKEPAGKISIKIKKAGAMVLSIGDKSPIGQALYLKRDDEKRVLLAKSSPKEWETTLFDLRDKSIFTYNTLEVTGMEIQRDGTTLRLTKNNNVWTVEGMGKGDAKDIEDMLNSLRAARVSAFVEDNPGDLAVFGLGSPMITVAVQATDKNTAQTLLIGAPSEGGKYYAKTGTSRNVFAVDLGLVDTVSKKGLDLLDKTLLDFKQENIAELNIRNNGENIHLRRDKSDPKIWGIEQPVHVESDNSAVNGLLQDLSETRVGAYVGRTNEDFARYELDSPRKELILLDKENKSIGVNIGKQSDDKKMYYAARNGERLIFTVQTEAVMKIIRSLQDLRNKKILKFEMDDVAKILIQYPDKTFELNRQGEDWSLAQPGSIRKIKPFIGKDVLWTLNNLEFEETASLENKETGLDHPQATITVMDRSNKAMVRLMIGSLIESRYFARVDGDKSVYRIKDRFMSEIPSDMKRFED